MATLSARAIRVRTAEGWQDIAVQGAQGAQGPPGPQGIQGAPGSTGPAGPPGTAPYVTTLPASPTDGQDVAYAANATAGVIWRLRYRTASISAYKWEFLGGGWLSIENVNGASITFGQAYVPVASMAITVPLAGEYAVHYGAHWTLGAAAQAGWLSVSLGTAASDADGDYLYTGATMDGPPVIRLLPTRTLTAGAQVALNARTGGASATANVNRCWLRLQPARVA